jgi:hypothetical protein
MFWLTMCLASASILVPPHPDVPTRRGYIDYFPRYPTASETQFCYDHVDQFGSFWGCMDAVGRMSSYDFYSAVDVYGTVEIVSSDYNYYEYDYGSLESSESSESDTFVVGKQTVSDAHEKNSSILSYADDYVWIV